MWWIKKDKKYTELHRKVEDIASTLTFDDFLSLCLRGNPVRIYDGLDFQRKKLPFMQKYYVITAFIGICCRINRQME